MSYVYIKYFFFEKLPFFNEILRNVTTSFKKAYHCYISQDMNNLYRTFLALHCKDFLKNALNTRIKDI